jgi:hypothetical protein
MRDLRHLKMLPNSRRGHDPQSFQGHDQAHRGIDQEVRVWMLDAAARQDQAEEEG